MYKLILITVLIFVTACLSAQAQTTLKEGVGFGRIVIGKSSFSDVVAAFGKDYKLVENKKYSYEIIYPNGLSFFYCFEDANKKIFSIAARTPFKGKTSKGIIAGKSTVKDLIRLYGKTYKTGETKESRFLYYDGISFEVKYLRTEGESETNIWENWVQSELFLKTKIWEITVEPKNPVASFCNQKKGS